MGDAQQQYVTVFFQMHIFGQRSGLSQKRDSLVYDRYRSFVALHLVIKKCSLAPLAFLLEI